MKLVRLEKSDEAQPHWLYDTSLPIAERPSKKMLFNSAKDVANYLAVVPERIYKNRNTKNLVYSPAFDKYFAVRVAKAAEIETYKAAVIRLKPRKSDEYGQSTFSIA